MVGFNSENGNSKHQQVAQAEVLHTISRTVARINHHDILKPVLNGVSRIVPVDAIGVYVVSDDKQSVERFSLISGHRRVIPGQGQKLPVSDSELAKLALENDDFLFSDLASFRNRLHDAEIAFRAGVRCAAAVAIPQAENDICGSVVFDSFAPSRYGDELFPFFRQVAELVGFYLENQRTLQQFILSVGHGTTLAEQNCLMDKLQGDMKWQLNHIALQLNQLGQIPFASPGIQRALQSLRKQTRDLLGELRTCLADQHVFTAAPITELLAFDLQLFEQRTGIKTRWGTFGTPRALSQKNRDAILNFLREALNASSRFSQPGQVKAQLLWREDTVVLEVEDDGCGFDPSQLKITDEQGGAMYRISAWANRAGGVLDVHSVPGWGTRLTLSVPTPTIAEYLLASNKMLPVAGIKNVTSVLLVETNENRRLVTLLAGQPDIKLAGEVACCDEMLDSLQRVYPDVIVVGTGVSGEKVKDLLVALKDQAPGPPVIALSQLGDQGSVDDEPFWYTVPVAPGSDIDADELVDTILRVAEGGGLKEEFKSITPDTPAKSREGKRMETLTGREKDILIRIAEGLSNQEIADQLVVQESTIRWHVHNILQKLGAKSRTHAARIAFEQGWL